MNTTPPKKGSEEPSSITKNEEVLTPYTTKKAMMAGRKSSDPSEKKPEQYSETKSSPQEQAPIDSTMFDLFRFELETHTTELSEGLLALEIQAHDKKILQSLMRAAHSIKGAARVVQIDIIVRLAHALEECFTKAQEEKLLLEDEHLDIMLQVVDILTILSHMDQSAFLNTLGEKKETYEKFIKVLFTFAQGTCLPPDLEALIRKQTTPQSIKNPSPPQDKPKITALPLEKKIDPTEPSKPQPHTSPNQDRILRVTADNLNRLMGLAGESLVESLWLKPFNDSLYNLKRTQLECSQVIDLLRDALEDTTISNNAENYLTQLQHHISEARKNIVSRISEFEMFIRSHASLSERLYGEIVNIRMRPFADGVKSFPRMVRDLAKQLGKKVKLEIIGTTTPVDRDILERLESPLTHLLRNAVDHGIESLEERIAAGKPPEGTIKLEAHHRAGMLAISVSDDGRGININRLIEQIQKQNLAGPEVVAGLSEPELLDFLFLPGFSTASKVTEISGRGVGLNIVQTMVQEVGGIIRTEMRPGKGMSFNLQLPLTLSVIRALLVQISDEPYAFPLSRIDHALYVSQDSIKSVENRQYFIYEGANIGLIHASQILELPQKNISHEELPVVLISDHLNCYGVVVDKFLGGKELVVQELDPNLGKVADISSGAFMENGVPLLIVDVEDMMRSIDKLLSKGQLTQMDYESTPIENDEIKEPKRILVVDDSITVREVECRLLQNQGYKVETAVNGMDGWNAVRTGQYDLVITDVDMPRMNGIQLVEAIKKDARLHALPVMIVSYKDRDEDRKKGLEAGANYYLTKSSFHDETLLNAVVDLIGKA